jgi:negative regulator of sigma E activity
MSVEQIISLIATIIAVASTLVALILSLVRAIKNKDIDQVQDVLLDIAQLASQHTQESEQATTEDATKTEQSDQSEQQ